MSTEKSIAMAKLGSMKTTTFNAIAELEIRAAAASENGDDAASSALSLKAVELARSAATIRRAEDKIRAGQSLHGVINHLDEIAQDARLTVKSLKTTVDALGDAAKLLSIIAMVSSIFL